MYKVRKLNIGKMEQIDALSVASGKLYSKVLVYFWRTVRKKGIWLKPSSMMRIFTAKSLHAHTTDAVIQSFYASLKSWRQRRKTDANVRPPKKHRKYYKLIYKSSSIRLKENLLMLSNGRDNQPLYFSWRWGMPKQIEIGWNGEQYELRAIYNKRPKEQILDNGVASVDLGEVHTATVNDGKDTLIFNGRLLRAKRHYQNKTKAQIASQMDTIKKGSKKWKRLKKAKNRQLKRFRNQIRDILHKQTTAIVSTLKERGVQTLVVGDVKGIRDFVDYGKKVNQKLHQLAFSQVMWMLKYKWEGIGGKYALQDEAYTSKECPNCLKRNEPRGRQYRCSCGFKYHRDGVGSMNIRRKYLGLETIPVLGEMAPPIAGVRYKPHMLCSPKESVCNS